MRGDKALEADGCPEFLDAVVALEEDLCQSVTGSGYFRISDVRMAEMQQAHDTLYLEMHYFLMKCKVHTALWQQEPEEGSLSMKA